jgi:polysaccharide export outer membrane protein
VVCGERARCAHGGKRARVAAWRPALLLGSAVVLAAGCSAGRGAGAATRVEGSAPGSASRAVVGGARAADLMRGEDMSRMTSLCETRSGGEPDGSGYRIGPDDLLEVRIPELLDPQAPVHSSSGGAAGGGAGASVLAGAPVFQQGLRVDAAGDITIATVGAVRASGLTVPELEKEIDRRLVAGGILRSPQVSVLVAEYRSRVVAVVGAVERPGMYPITKPGTTLGDLIWTAGGPTRDAGRVVQFTPVPDANVASANGPPVRMDLEFLLHANANAGAACALNPPARSGDVINVALAGTVQVAGWVDKPGSVQVTRGLTVTGALAAAGGDLYPADLESVTVKRNLGPGDEQTYTVDLVAVADGREKDLPLTDGDVVTVPYSSSKLVPYGLWAFSKEMIHVGGTIPLF